MCKYKSCTGDGAYFKCERSFGKGIYQKSKNPDEVMQQFREKNTFLCACEMISEGWDYPELGILVMASNTFKVLYMQQIGRGLRRTNTKTNVFVIDVVDEYGAMAKPCSMHSIFLIHFTLHLEVF